MITKPFWPARLDCTPTFCSVWQDSKIRSFASQFRGTCFHSVLSCDDKTKVLYQLCSYCLPCSFLFNSGGYWPRCRNLAMYIFVHRDPSSHGKQQLVTTKTADCGIFFLPLNSRLTKLLTLDRDGHIMLQIFPIMLCSSAPIFYPLCPHRSPIMLQLCFKQMCY